MRLLCCCRHRRVSACTLHVVQVESPFKQHTLQAVVFLLRFLHHPSDATSANLAAVEPHTAGIIQLAHSLDVVGPLHTAIDDFVASKLEDFSGVAAWLPLAEQHGLERALAQGHQARQLCCTTLARGAAGSLPHRHALLQLGRV